MTQTSKIEWTDATWNPVTGCSVVSPGCTNCYAMRLAARLERMLPPERSGDNVLPNHYTALTTPSKAGPVWTGRVNVAPWRILTEPLRRKKPTMFFVNSMADLFHEGVPNRWIDRIFAVMAMAPQHTFQVLTKRSARAREYMTKVDVAARIALACATIPQIGREVMVANATWPLPNVWIGASVEDQRRAEERIPDLLATPARVRFLSCEPLLGPVDLMNIQRPAPLGSMSALPCDEYGHDGQTWSVIDWIICGGESGPGARPMHPDWARSLRDQCKAAGVPFLFKQWGEWAPDTGLLAHGCDPIMEGARCAVWSSSGDWRFYENGYKPPLSGNLEWMYRLGKKRAGRLLDGVTHDEFPRSD